MFFEDLSLFLQEEILFKLFPEDLLVFCSMNENFEKQFCQNQEFWGRYFLARNQTLPKKISIPQYYYEQYYQFDRVEKYLNYLSYYDIRFQSFTRSINLKDLEEINPELFRDLDLDPENQDKLNEFFQKYNKILEDKNIRIFFTQESEGTIILHLSLFRYTTSPRRDLFLVSTQLIKLTENQTNLLLGRLLAEGTILLDRYRKEIIL